MTVFTLLAALVALVAAVLAGWPLFSRSGGHAADDAAAHDIEVYRDQLAELERDRAAQLISAGEADGARAEIARRLIKADQALSQAKTSARPVPMLFAIVVMAVVPVTGLLLYQRIGAPGEPDRPLAERLRELAPDDVPAMVAKVEARLEENPQDGEGWQVLAPIYMQLRQPEQSAEAWLNAARFLGPTPERLGRSGEALVIAAQGKVTPDAKARFEAVLKIDPKDAMARFYLAVEREQAGKLEEAKAAFAALAASAPKDAPWLGIVNEHVAVIERRIASGDTGAAPGNPDEADMAAAANMSAEDRAAMIATMVEGLDARLQDNPDNFEGWMRLVRSRMMLGQADEARAALERALKTFPAATQKGADLIAAAETLGIDTKGLTP